MANRTMEAKRIKYLKQSRARPRSLRMNNGQQKVHQSVDKSKIPEEWLELFDYRSRGNTAPTSRFDEFFFPRVSNIPSKSRAEAVWTALNWKFQARPDKVLSVELVKGKYRRVTFYYTSKMDCFYFIEFQVLPNVLRRSITYNDHDRAMEKFHNGVIRWKERVYCANLNIEDVLASLA